MIDAGVTIFTTEDIRKNGSKYIMDEAFKIALNGTNGTHVSYDLDISVIILLCFSFDTVSITFNTASGVCA